MGKASTIEQAMRNEYTYLKMNNDVVKSQLAKRPKELHGKAFEGMRDILERSEEKMNEAIAAFESAQAEKERAKLEYESSVRASKQMTIDVILAEEEVKTFKKNNLYSLHGNN